MSAACERFDAEGVPRLVAGEPPSEHEVGCASCQRARDQYLRIIEGLADLPVEKAPSGWQNRVLAALPAEPRRPVAAARSWPIWGALAAAAAILLWRVAKQEPSPGRLAVRQEVVAAASGRRADSATVGDTVRVLVTGGEGAVREARLYRDTGELVARCLGSSAPPAPGVVSCAAAGTDLELTVTLTAPGSYRTLAIVGSQAAPEPAGSLDEDAAAAAAAGASVELSRAIDVE